MSILKNDKLFFPVTKIYYALVSEISEIEDKPDGSVEVTFESGEDWKLLYSTRDSISFEDAMKEVDEGIVFNQSIEFRNPGDDIDNNISIEGLANEKLIFKLSFLDAEAKILGDLENPAKLTSSYKNEGYQSQRIIKITRQSWRSAPYIFFTT